MDLRYAETMIDVAKPPSLSTVGLDRGLALDIISSLYAEHHILTSIYFHILLSSIKELGSNNYLQKLNITYRPLASLSLLCLRTESRLYVILKPSKKIKNITV